MNFENLPLIILTGFNGRQKKKSQSVLVGGFGREGGGRYPTMHFNLGNKMRQDILQPNLRKDHRLYYKVTIMQDSERYYFLTSAASYEMHL